MILKILTELLIYQTNNYEKLKKQRGVTKQTNLSRSNGSNSNNINHNKSIKMIRWIKNSKGSITNTTTKYKGISVTKYGKYKACVRVKNRGVYKDSKQHVLYIGNFDTLKEAKAKRVEYILSLL